jgi:hypothetical protein
MTVFSILLVGMLLGMKHATEADHVAAVATLATRQASLVQTLQQGVAWGVGHTLSLMLFGGVVFVLGHAISPGLEQALETAVGIMLVLLGADVLRRLIVKRISSHVHSVEPVRRWPMRAIAVGMMHGLAGSAALVMLSLKSLPSWSIGLGYIVVFGFGSMVGMALLSAAMALPLRLSAPYLIGLHRSMTALIGLCSCALGSYMVVEIGYLRAALFG